MSLFLQIPHIHQSLGEICGACLTASQFTADQDRDRLDNPVTK